MRNKELVLDPDEIRKQLDQFIFKGGDTLVSPEVRIQMLDEAFDDFDRPQALRDAINLAESEETLF